MNKNLDDLIQQLTLQAIAEDSFLGKSTDLFNTGRIFGGQILGQALAAAQQTIDPARHAHSLHAYFVRPGNTKLPIQFDVTRSRDGRSFSVRHVTASQENKVIFQMSCSFQLLEEGLERFDAWPDEVLPPEQCLDYQDAMAKLFHGRDKAEFFDQQAFEVRMPYVDRILERAQDRYTMAWYKAAGPLPKDDLVQKSLLAYISDFNLLYSSVYRNGFYQHDDKFQMASLDHAMWFHRPIDLNQWHLYVNTSTTTMGSRSLCMGQVYSEDGVLIASTAQEGLTRINNRKK
ncbi:acyl-CoA thioesterase [Brackiella oedipodis]|uniref:acyl-CoA thioesterase n=1 Tax=Brackiella oedipodis TaxID=124225 RepID=UPI00048A9620|nr:acyl-CoA thioesterase II [Brackiella oedipodis]